MLLSQSCLVCASAASRRDVGATLMAGDSIKAGLLSDHSPLRVVLVQRDKWFFICVFLVLGQACHLGLDA